MNSFTDEQVARWARNMGAGDPRWAFALMSGRDSRERWLVGYRCGLVFPMFRVDESEHATLREAFDAFMDSPAWKTVEWLAGKGFAHNESSLARFDAKSERLRALVDD